MEWMSKKILEFTVLLASFFLLVHRAAGGTCPRDIFSSVFACFRYIQGPSGKEFVVAGADLRAVKGRCEDGSFNKAVGCVRNLHHVCQHSERKTLLKHLANAENMDQGFKVFCDNLYLYGDNKECLLQTNAEIQQCIGQYQNMFDFEMNRSHDNEAAMMETVCNFLTGMTGCIDRPVRDSCDPALADILQKFMSGITPPVCEPYTNGAHSSYVNISYTACWILLCIAVSSILDIHDFKLARPLLGR